MYLAEIRDLKTEWNGTGTDAILIHILLCQTSSNRDVTSGGVDAEVHWSRVVPDDVIEHSAERGVLKHDGNDVDYNKVKKTKMIMFSYRPVNRGERKKKEEEETTTTTTERTNNRNNSQKKKKNTRTKKTRRTASHWGENNITEHWREAR